MSSLPFDLDPEDPLFLEWSGEVRCWGFPQTALFGFYRSCYDDVAHAARFKEFWKSLKRAAGTIDVGVTAQSLFTVTLRDLRGDFPAETAERNYALLTKIHTRESRAVENHFFNRMLKKLLDLEEQEKRQPVLVESS